jgi:hypothetical protein
MGGMDVEVHHSVALTCAEMSVEVHTPAILFRGSSRMFRLGGTVGGAGRVDAVQPVYSHVTGCVVCKVGRYRMLTEITACNGDVTLRMCVVILALLPTGSGNSVRLGRVCRVKCNSSFKCNYHWCRSVFFSC